MTDQVNQDYVDALFHADDDLRASLKDRSCCALRLSRNPDEGHYLVATQDIKPHDLITAYPAVVALSPPLAGTENQFGVYFNEILAQKSGQLSTLLDALNQFATEEKLAVYKVALPDGWAISAGTKEMVKILKPYLTKENALGHYANHSWNPNAAIGVEPLQNTFQIGLMATKYIQKGSKIHINYGHDFWKGNTPPRDFDASRPILQPSPTSAPHPIPQPTPTPAPPPRPAPTPKPARGGSQRVTLRAGHRPWTYGL